MSMFDNMKDKVSKLVDDHGDKVAEGLDKAGDFADEKTGGKYSDKIDAAQEQARKMTNQMNEDDGRQ
jgi:antitoxin protein of toxin-antitoxin system